MGETPCLRGTSYSVGVPMKPGVPGIRFWDSGEDPLLTKQVSLLESLDELVPLSSLQIEELETLLSEV